MEFLSQEKLNNIINDPQAGIYLIDKPKNTHSFKAVSVLRKILQIKKVGFAGTLDPLASGLLILATGKATKLLDWFHVLPKTYQAEILFGQTSDTYDLEGMIVTNESATKFSRNLLQKKLSQFLGKQEQQAPIYSAKKVAGQKLHHLARQGKKIIPPKSEIEIYSLEIKKFNYPNLSLRIKSSAGTYIRSLAHDLGQELNTGALLADLRRTSIGPFSVNQTLPLADITQEKLTQAKISPQAIIKFLDQWFFQSRPW